MSFFSTHFVIYSSLTKKIQRRVSQMLDLRTHLAGGKVPHTPFGGALGLRRREKSTGLSRRFCITCLI